MNDEPAIERLDSLYSVTLHGAFSRQLVRNTIFNGIGRFWSFLVLLVLTPYTLSRLSVADFGVWVLLSVFTGTFALLDFGLGFSFVKFVSEYRSSEDFERINRVIFSGVAFYLLFGCAVVAGGLALGPLLFGVFRIEAAASAYLLVLAAFAVGNLARLFLSVLRGLQRMDQSNIVEMAMTVPGVIGTVLALESGLGIYGLALNALAVAVLTTAVAWRRLRRVEPRIALRFALDRALVRKLFGYGIRLQVGRLGALICFQVDKLIVSRFLGVAAVSFYEVSARLTLFMRALPLVMISALVPAVSELEARDDKHRVLKAYFLATRYIVIVTVGVVAFVVVEARPLLALWLGPGFEQSVVLVQVLAIGYGVNAISESASQTGSGIGRPDIDMRGAVLLTLLNPILSIALVRELGAVGAALGTSIALISSAAYVIWAFHRVYVGRSAVTLLREVHMRPWLAAVSGVLAVLLLRSSVPVASGETANRLLTALAIAVDLGAFGLAYLLALVALRHVTPVDWRNLMRIVSFGYAFLRRPFTGLSGAEGIGVASWPQNRTGDG